MGIRKSSDFIESQDEESPIRAIFCLKKRTMNMTKIEEVEDCFILDFDPSESPSKLKLSLSESPELSDDTDLSLVYEKGQVACRDYPHPRHLCVKFPFEKTPHESHCEMCFCYMCETEAPCKQWTLGLKHCDATTDDNNKFWKLMKNSHKKMA